MTRPTPSGDAEQWMRLWVDSSLLMSDAAAVMAMRGWRMMLGGQSADREAERMVAEKVEAMFELAGALASGRVKTSAGAARKTVSIYAKRVRANRRRLG